MVAYAIMQVNARCSDSPCPARCAYDEVLVLVDMPAPAPILAAFNHARLHAEDLRKTPSSH